MQILAFGMFSQPSIQFAQHIFRRPLYLENVLGRLNRNNAVLLTFCATFAIVGFDIIFNDL